MLVLFVSLVGVLNKSKQLCNYSLKDRFPKLFRVSSKNLRRQMQNLFRALWSSKFKASGVLASFFYASICHFLDCFYFLFFPLEIWILELFCFFSLPKEKFVSCYWGRSFSLLSSLPLVKAWRTTTLDKPYSQTRPNYNFK